MRLACACVEAKFSERGGEVTSDFVNVLVQEHVSECVFHVLAYGHLFRGK